MYRKHLSMAGRCGHALLIVAGWSLFGAGWWWVLVNPDATVGLSRLMGVTLVALMGFPLITQWWISHNFQRGIPRVSAPEKINVPHQWQRDWNGLVLLMNPGEIRHSPWVQIRAKGEIKSFSDKHLTSFMPCGEAA